jgi:hypothetical protein
MNTKEPTFSSAVPLRTLLAAAAEYKKKKDDKKNKQSERERLEIHSIRSLQQK